MSLHQYIWLLRRYSTSSSGAYTYPLSTERRVMSQMYTPHIANIANMCRSYFIQGAICCMLSVVLLADHTSEHQNIGAIYW